MQSFVNRLLAARGTYHLLDGLPLWRRLMFAAQALLRRPQV